MSYGQGHVVQRASGVEPTILPEPISREDPARVAQLSVRRSRLRDLGITDEDGRGRIPEYVLDVPAYEVVPQTVKDGWTRGSSGRVLGPNGKYVSKASDTPRLSYDGGEPGLLVEAAARTNQAPDSSDPTAWNTGQSGPLSSVSGSIFADQASNGKINPQSVKASTGDTFDQVNHSCGSFNSGVEVQYLIIEQDTSDQTAISIRNDTDGANGPLVEYRFSTETINIYRGPVRRADARVLSESGPNGGKLVQLIAEYDLSQAGTLDSGDVRSTQLMPDRDGDKGATILHHHQVEAAPNTSSPIVTGSSATTRAGDDKYAIFEDGQPSWWNPDEGTILVDFTFTIYQRNGSTELVSGGDRTKRILGVGQNSGAPVIFSADASGNDLGEVSEEIPRLTQPFQKSSYCVSFNNSIIRLSVDGRSDSTFYSGSFVNTNTLKIGNFQELIGIMYKLIYIPGFFSESTLNRITR